MCQTLQNKFPIEHLFLFWQQAGTNGDIPFA